MLKHTILTIAILSTGTVVAAETDTFTSRDLPLQDSSEILNRVTNGSVSESITEANLKGAGCDERLLYKELRKHFGNHTNSTFDEKITHNLAPMARDIKLEDSIYRDWRPWDGMGMGLGIAKATGLTMSPVIRVGHQLIGTDKLEHMYGQGFRYFEKNYLDKKGTVAAVKKGIIGEKTFLGGNKIGNGVFSYGDLSANFNGMRFWNHMLQLRDDVLGAQHNLGPYIVCTNNQWVQVKTIDFRDYIDESMDEAINCSKFPSKKTAAKFTARLKKMNMRCPLVPEKLEALKKKYGPVAHWIINEEGTGDIRYTGEFKKR